MRKIEAGQRRREACSAGAKTYHGSECKKCGLTERYVSESSCIACAKRRAIAWPVANREVFLIARRIYDKKSYWANPEKYRALHRGDSGKRYRENGDKEKQRAAQRRWSARNRHKETEKAARWRSRGKAASPKWLRASGQMQQIRHLYLTARIFGMHVDHVIPLAGCRVCGAVGLHVLANLQLLAGSTNGRKADLCDICWS